MRPEFKWFGLELIWLRILQAAELVIVHISIGLPKRSISTLTRVVKTRDKLFRGDWSVPLQCSLEIGLTYIERIECTVPWEWLFC
jgi:hypothetical protein